MSWYDDYDELAEVLATHPTPAQIEDALDDGRIPAAYADRARAYSIPNTTECRICSGSGQVELYQGDLRYSTQRCRNCSGTGRVLIAGAATTKQAR